MARPTFSLEKLPKTGIGVCLPNTFFGKKSFYKKSSKPNKALNIWPDFDSTGVTWKQTKNKDSKPKQIKHEKNIKNQNFLNKTDQIQNKWRPQISFKHKPNNMKPKPD